MAKILIIDDDHSIRRMILRHLKRAGHDVTEADSGTMALPMIRQQKPELVILDFNMPGIDGLETLSEIRKIDEGLPVVMLTADSGSRLTVQAFLQGADDFVVKPPDMDSFLGVVIPRAMRKRQLAQAQLALAAEQQASKLKMALLTNIGHELRTPLSHIVSHLEFLGDDIAENNPEGVQRSLSKSVLATQNLKALIDRITQLAMLESGEVQLQHSQGMILSLVEEAVVKLFDKAKEKNIMIQISGEGFSVKMDQEKIMISLGEILDNAIKFSPQDSTVNVAIKDCGNTLEIAITDSGPGVSETEKQTIFKPFALGNATADGSGGKGLGLAIAMRIIVIHGGTIHVNNCDGGRGAIFTVSLPKL